MTVGLTVTHRRYVTYADAHYGGNLVNGAYVLDLFGDVGGEALGAEGLAEDDGVDRLVDDLLEARHVDTGLLRVEVDEAFEVGVVEGFILGGAAVLAGADADDLLDADDADPGEAHPGRRCLRLGVAARCCDRLCGVGGLCGVGHG